MKTLLTLALVAAAGCLYAQTVYVPSGSSGIGTNSTNSFVGIGSGASAPDEMLHVFGNIRLGQPSATTPTTYFINVAQGGYTINNGNGRGLTIQAGSTDNNAGKIGGLLTLTGGAPTSPATAFGHVSLAPNNGFVGVGTTSPTYKFHVNGVGSNSVDMKVNGRILSGDGANNGGLYVNSAATMFMGQNGANLLGLYNNGVWNLIADNTGKVGIGTTTPSTKLQVSGLGSYNVDLTVTGRIITGDANNFGGIWLNNAASMLVGQQSATTLGLYNNNEWRLIVNSAGNVGIGTTAPGNYKLAVEGKIGAREVNVTTAPWADYVFAEDYKLPSLETLERYIVKNKHLPEVPTQKEVEVSGVDLGAMSALLLKKIEELTLYQIEANKQIQKLQQEVEHLKGKK